MAIIPDVTVSHLRPDFKQRIDIDRSSPKCIWCKSGGNKKKHQLLDCPNAFPQPDQRTPFSSDVFASGHGDFAVAYIQQLQQAYDQRQDGMTPFNSGRLRYQISHIPDAAPPAPAPAPAPAAATSAPAAAATASAITTPAPPAGTLSSSATTSASTTSTSANAGSTASTAPPAPAMHILGSAVGTANVAPSSASTDMSIPIVYEDENVQPLQAGSPPKLEEMQRGGLFITSKADADQKLSTLQGVTLDFPARQSFTKATGRVYTNHFQLSIKSDQKLYKYTIESTRPGRNRRKLRALMKTVIRSYDFLRDNAAVFATDYFATIIAWKPLHSAIGPRHTRLSGDGQSPDSIWRLRPELLDGPNPVAVNLIYDGEVDVAGLLNHTEVVPNYATADLEPTKRALNIVISKCFGEATNDMIQVGANKFFHKRGTHALFSKDTHGSVQSSVTLEAMRGYFYTIKPGVRNVLLNINPCTSAFFKKVRVSEVMEDTLTFNEWELEGVLRGLRVRIQLDRGNQQADLAAFARLNSPQARVKTIQGLGYSLREQTFDDANGIRQNVFAHLQNTYPGRPLKHPDLPAVNLGSSFEPKWYAPEDLVVMPYQRYTSMVPTALTESMLGVACLTPNEAASRVDVEALTALGVPPTQTGARPLSACSVVTLNPQMLLVPSHQFGCPSIQYGNEAVVNMSTWNLIKKDFYRHEKKPFQVLVLADTDVQIHNVNKVKKQFRMFADVNYKVSDTTFLDTYSLANPKNAARIRNIIESSKPDLVLFILANRNVEAYSRFKDLTDRTFGCHSICMTERILGSGLGSSMGNIMMKVNLKAAGSNHTIVNGKLKTIMKDTLVLGADVTHPSGGSILGCPSIAAIVGSVDDHAGRFLGSMRLQGAGKKEIIDNVEDMVVERIKDWIVINGFRLPKNIIYYRDGVSEGQYKFVRDDELSKITSAFPRALRELKREQPNKVMDGETPKLTAIVCAKRHHVRFYPEKGGTKNGNCPPGTYVDDVVTSPYYADFYLQSHSPLQGTARPAHYFVLRNEMAVSIDNLRQFTHELCFTYVRTTGAVSYASPAYYADRLCERGRCYLRDFFVNTDGTNPHQGKTLRQQFKDFKRGQEQGKANARITQYGSPWNTDGTRRAKSVAEQTQELNDRKAVEDSCVNQVMRLARREFYKYGEDRNPWHSGVAKTMFWM